LHENQFGAQCHISDCTNQKTKGTQACWYHQEEWRKHVQKHKHHTASGSCRIFKQREAHPWEWPVQANQQPHDEGAEELAKSNYFSPARFYCVETVCAPCGVVIAWAKFAKSELPTNILAFLETIFPTEES
jgi:hypothetical protein